MEFEQVQEYCKEAQEIAERLGTHAGLSFLIGEKIGVNFSQLRKARRKLQFLYSSDDMSEDHPLNQGGRVLKMSYAMTVKEHYNQPMEQVKYLESLLEDFAKTVLITFSQDEIKSYLESSPNLAYDSNKYEESESATTFSVDDLLLEAEEILAVEDIKKLLIQDKEN
jgi:glutaredoxin-related protein